MIAVLGGLADVERDLIRTRTGEGRARAKLRGQHMGRPAKMTVAQKQEARRRRKTVNPLLIWRDPMASVPPPSPNDGMRLSDGGFAIGYFALCSRSIGAGLITVFATTLKVRKAFSVLIG